MRCCGTRWRSARRRRCAWSRPAGRRARARPAWSAASRNRPPRSPRPSASMYGVPDLVLCGDLAADRATGSFPAFLAASLGAEQALGCVRLEPVDDRTLRVHRRLDGGRREVLMVRPPAVVSVEAAGVRLRRAGLPATLARAKHRDHGGQRAGGRGAADQGPRRPPVPAPAARASRADRHRAAPDAGADRGARPAHSADRGRPAAPGPGRQRTAGLPAPMWLPGRRRPGLIARPGGRALIGGWGGVHWRVLCRRASTRAASRNGTTRYTAIPK